VNQRGPALVVLAILLAAPTAALGKPRPRKAKPPKEPAVILVGPSANKATAAWAKSDLASMGGLPAGVAVPEFEWFLHGLPVLGDGAGDDRVWFFGADVGRECEEPWPPDRRTDASLEPEALEVQVANLHCRRSPASRAELVALHGARAEAAAGDLGVLDAVMLDLARLDLQADWGGGREPREEKAFMEARLALRAAGTATLVVGGLGAMDLLMDGVPLTEGRHSAAEGPHLVQLRQETGWQSKTITLRAGAAVAVGPPGWLWERVVEGLDGLAPAASLKGSPLGRAIRTALVRPGKRTFVAIIPVVAELTAETGRVRTLPGGARYRPQQALELGVGYLLLDNATKARPAFADPLPTAHWFPVRLGLALRFHFIDFHMNLAFTPGPPGVKRPYTDGSTGTPWHIGFRAGLGVEAPHRPVRPGARVALQVLGVGPQTIQRDGNYSSTWPLSADLVGAVVSGTLAIRFGRSRTGMMLVAGGGWSGAFTAHGEVRFLLRRW